MWLAHSFDRSQVRVLSFSPHYPSEQVSWRISDPHLCRLNRYWKEREASRPMHNRTGTKEETWGIREGRPLPTSIPYFPISRKSLWDTILKTGPGLKAHSHTGFQAGSQGKWGGRRCRGGRDYVEGMCGRRKGSVSNGRIH